MGMRTLRIPVLVALGIVGLAGSAAAAPGRHRPEKAGRIFRIDCIEPRVAVPGDRVTISDNSLNPGQMRITVGNVPAVIVSARGRRATFIVPAVPAGRAVVRASNPGGRTGLAILRIRSSVTAGGKGTVTAPIGSGGGILQTTQAGRRYTLSVPDGALAQSVTVSMTPVTAIGGFPFSGGLVAAVRFAPDGLQFLQPVTLTIEGVSPPASNTPEPQALVGFSVDGTATKYTLLPSQIDGSLIRVTVSHFSSAGIANASIADFERIVRPILNSLPANVSPQVVESLVGQLNLWLERFGMPLCAQTTLCHDIFDIGIRSLQAELLAAVARMNGHIAAHEPFLAFNDIGTVVALFVQLVEVETIAAAGLVDGFAVTVSLDPLKSPLSALIALAKSEAEETPTVGLFNLLGGLHAVASELALDDLVGEAGAALLSALHTLLNDGDRTCVEDPDQGEALLNIVRTGNGFDVLVYAEGLEPGIQARFDDTWSACRIRVSPDPGTVAVFEDLQFGGQAVGLASSMLAWALEHASGQATIDSTGLFSNANVTGGLIVVATSQADPARRRRVRLTVVPVEVKVSPQTATITTAQSHLFTATVTGPRNQAVTWSATGGSIDSTGLFQSTSVGTFTVRATSVLNDSLFGEATVVVKEPELRVFLGTLTYFQSARPGDGGGESLTLEVWASLDDPNGFPVVEAVGGPADALITHPDYCSPIYEFHGQAVFGEFLANDSGLPGDLSMKVGATGTVTGSGPVLDPGSGNYVCRSGSQQSSAYMPSLYLIGTFVRSGGEIVAIDFFRSYTWADGTTVTSTGRLVLLR
jgi:hypothetical protein